MILERVSNNTTIHNRTIKIIITMKQIIRAMFHILDYMLVNSEKM